VRYHARILQKTHEDLLAILMYAVGFTILMASMMLISTASN